METFRLGSFPDECSTISVAYFRDVINASDLRARLIAAAKAVGPEGDRERDDLDFAFIDADLLVSREQLLAAVYQTLLALTQGRLRTKTAHSEILLCLSPASNISEAIKVFGISASSRQVVLVRIRERSADTATDEDLLSRMLGLVRGSLVSMDNLGSAVDWSRLHKVYKLQDLPAMEGWTDAARRKVIEPILTSAVATKTVAA